MRGKVILILLGLVLIFSSSLLIACGGGKEESPFKEPDRKVAEPLTPEEQFQKAIEPFVLMLGVAEILEEGIEIEDPLYNNILALRGRLAEGTPLEELKPEDYGAMIVGPFPDVKPEDVHEKFIELVSGVEPGQPSKILFAEGHGYALAYVVAKNEETGAVEVAVALIQAAATTTTEAAEDAPADTISAGEA